MFDKCQLKKIQADNRGLTLIELIVSLAISSFVILGAYSLVMIGSKSYQRTNRVTNLQNEITFASNIVGEAIRSGDSDNSLIWKVYDGSGNITDIVLYLGYVSGAADDVQKRVFHYSASDKSLYVYLSEGEVDITDTADLQAYIGKDDTTKSEHIVSKYIEEFDVFSVSDNGTTGPTDSEYEDIVKVGDFSKLIKVTITVQIKKNKDSSDVIYQIRN